METCCRKDSPLDLRPPPIQLLRQQMRNTALTRLWSEPVRDKQEGMRTVTYLTRRYPAYTHGGIFCSMDRTLHFRAFVNTCPPVL